MEKYTWNIIFMAIDVQHKDIKKDYDINKDIDPDLETIEYVFENFSNAILKMPDNYSCNIWTLKYYNESEIGKATLSSNEKIKNKLEDYDSNYDFNCHQSCFYKTYFNTIYKKTKDLLNQKYIILFTGHSFGSGFFYFNNNCLTTNQLSKSIYEGFEKRCIDAFFAINCTIQSIETNLIFNKTTKFFIGSQQALFVKTLWFVTFLNDLSNIKDLPDECILSKFIASCLNIRINKNLGLEKVLFNSSISITQPPKSLELMGRIYNFTNFILDVNKKLKPELIETINKSRFACEDPSKSNNINIIDASLFFSLLKFHLPKKVTNYNLLIQAIEDILSAIKKLIVVNAFHPDCVQYLIDISSIPINTFFMPNGVGIFIPKNKGLTAKTTLNIYQEYFNTLDFSNENFLTESPHFQDLIDYIYHDLLIIVPKDKF